MKDISLKDLLEAGCHFGHQTVRWNPKMRPYIFEAREGVHIFDLVKTKEGLEETCAFLKKVAADGGKILFIGTKRQAREMVKKAAIETGMPYVTERWLGGILTNFEQIKKSLDRAEYLKTGKADGSFKSYTKKENLLFEREAIKLEKFFGGLKGVEKMPEAVFIVDVKTELNAVKEAERRQVKVAAIVDTNSDPDMVDYVIPANDDANKSVDLLVTAVKEAILEGLKSRKPAKEDNPPSLKASEDKVK